MQASVNRAHAPRRRRGGRPVTARPAGRSACLCALHMEAPQRRRLTHLNLAVSSSTSGGGARIESGPLLNVEGGKSPWAGFGIGSYDGPAPPDGGELLQPTLHKQLFIDSYALASATGIRRKLHRPTKQAGAVLRSPIQGFSSLKSRSGPQWNPTKQIWEWWLHAQRDDAGDGAGADGGGDGGRAQIPAAALRAEKFFSAQREGEGEQEGGGEAYHPDDIRAKAKGREGRAHH